MDLNIENYIAFARRELTPDRFEHSLGVMHMMGELASIYALDHTAALVSGILHDAAKELAADDQLDLVKKGNLSLNDPCDRHPMFLHGPAGACYITQELGIQDALVLDAITRHSYFGTGVALSPAFCWCLRFADILEPTREWKEVQRQLKPFIYSGRMQEGAYLQTKWMIPFLEAKSIPVHPNLHRVLNELSALKKADSLCEPHSLPV